MPDVFLVKIQKYVCLHEEKRELMEMTFPRRANMFHGKMKDFTGLPSKQGDRLVSHGGGWESLLHGNRPASDLISCAGGRD
jgi:hypothetical protein